MTSEDVIREVAEALRDVIVASDESYLRGDPETAFVDLACRLIFRMKTVTVVPVRARETEIRQADAEGATRIFETLNRWLQTRGAGIRSVEASVNVTGRTEFTMIELARCDGENSSYEVKGFFQGESLRDACAQAAQVVLFEEDDS